MTCEINVLVKGGTAPEDIRLSVGIGKPKPMVVNWAWQSWDKLKQQREIIKAGWARCGIADVSAQTGEQKVEAMSLCMIEPNPVLGEEPEVEADGAEEEEEEDKEEEKEEEKTGEIGSGVADVPTEEANIASQRVAWLPNCASERVSGVKC